MAKLRTDKVYLPTGSQKSIIDKGLKQGGSSLTEMAALLKISDRTLRDWRREKYKMNYGALCDFCKHATMPLPKNIVTKPQYHHLPEAAKKGGLVTMQKYGRVVCDSNYRRQQWESWWQASGKHNPPPQSQPYAVHKPKSSKKLAEFAGIMIGDGGITKRQVTVTLNRTDDRDYARYVTSLCAELFKVEPSLYHRVDHNVVNIVISRSQLVTYCKSIGLPQGDKINNKIRIPTWIRENEVYLKSCLRGLFDTDGGLFEEVHKIKGKRYAYPRLAFVSASKPLLNDVSEQLIKLGFDPKIRSGKRVQLEKRAEIVHYFTSVGTSNPKHARRYKKYMEGCVSG